MSTCVTIGYIKSRELKLSNTPEKKADSDSEILFFIFQNVMLVG